VGDLVNEFSWSWSKGKRLRTCPRAFYYATYGYWGGWDKDACPRARALYVLKKSNNVWGWVGKHLHDAITEMITHNFGNPDQPMPPSHATEDRLARMYREATLSNAGCDERTGKAGVVHYKHNPKHQPPLIEHLRGESIGHRWPWIKEMVRQGLYGLAASGWWDITRTTQFAVENLIEFTIGGVKCWCCIDAEYTTNTGPYSQTDVSGRVLIDWKTSEKGIRQEDQEQVIIYALARPAEQLVVCNVVTNDESRFPPHAHDLRAAERRIAADVEKMRSFLVDGDIEANVPKPENEWGGPKNSKVCHWCEFRDVCTLKEGS
jgi:hypothetical protein